MQSTSCEQIKPSYANSYHVLHPSPAGNDSPALYVLLPQLHPQVGQHSSSPAGTTTPPGKLQEGDSQSTSYDGCSSRNVPVLYYKYSIIYVHTHCAVCCISAHMSAAIGAAFLARATVKAYTTALYTYPKSSWFRANHCIKTEWNFTQWISILYA